MTPFQKVYTTGFCLIYLIIGCALIAVSGIMVFANEHWWEYLMAPFALFYGVIILIAADILQRRVFNMPTIYHD